MMFSKTIETESVPFDNILLIWYEKVDIFSLGENLRWPETLKYSQQSERNTWSSEKAKNSLFSN